MTLLTKNTLRIVHVEDNHDFAELCRINLERAGFSHPIVHFASGAQAIEYLSATEPERQPHVILLDLNMPEMGGLELLSWLRNDHHPRNLAVFLLTSSEAPEHVRQATEAGVTKYLVKRYTFDRLVTELEQLILRENSTPAQPDFRLALASK